MTADDAVERTLRLATPASGAFADSIARHTVLAYAAGPSLDAGSPGAEMLRRPRAELRAAAANAASLLRFAGRSDLPERLRAILDRIADGPDRDGDDLDHSSSLRCPRTGLHDCGCDDPWHYESPRAPDSPANFT